MGEDQVIGCIEMWDYANGYVVCTNTGEVVDRIYCYGEMRRREQLGNTNKANDSTKLTGRKSKKYLNYIELEMKAKRMVRKKPWLTVDYAKLYSQGRFVNTIKSWRSIKAVKEATKEGIRPVLNKILEAVEAVEPAALARTERAKYTLAYLIYLMASGKPIIYNDISKMFNVSWTTIKRMEKLAKEIRNKILSEYTCGERR